MQAKIQPIIKLKFLIQQIKQLMSKIKPLKIPLIIVQFRINLIQIIYLGQIKAFLINK